MWVVWEFHPLKITGSAIAIASGTDLCAVRHIRFGLWPVAVASGNEPPPSDRVGMAPVVAPAKISWLDGFYASVPLV